MRCNRLNAHIKFDLAPTPTCCCCGHEDQTAEHILQRWPFQHAERQHVGPVTTLSPNGQATDNSRSRRQHLSLELGWLCSRAANVKKEKKNSVLDIISLTNVRNSDVIASFWTCWSAAWCEWTRLTWSCRHPWRQPPGSFRGWRGWKTAAFGSQRLGGDRQRSGSLFDHCPACGNPETKGTDHRDDRQLGGFLACVRRLKPWNKNNRLQPRLRAVRQPFWATSSMFKLKPCNKNNCGNK